MLQKWQFLVFGKVFGYNLEKYIFILFQAPSFKITNSLYFILKANESKSVFWPKT